MTFHENKTTVQACGTIECASGWLSEHNGLMLDGYEIHTGTNEFREGCVPFLRLNGREEVDGVTNARGNVLGSYLHGIFDTGSFWHSLVAHVRELKGIQDEGSEVMTMEEFRRREFDRLADGMRQNLDMDAVYKILRGEDVPIGRWNDD